MEERNIKLSIEKAREFYSKGGELKDLALSAFTEGEILASILPKTWEEFCKNNPIEGGIKYYIGALSNIVCCNSKGERYIESDRNLLPLREAAGQHLVLMQLHQLRDCYRQGWAPDFSNSYTSKYCIHKIDKNDIRIFEYYTYNSILSFRTEELAKEFLNNFRDLIEQAGDLI